MRIKISSNPYRRLFVEVAPLGNPFEYKGVYTKVLKIFLKYFAIRIYYCKT